MSAEKAVIMDCLRKRDLLNRDQASPVELIRLGEKFLAAGLISDCIDFFAKANHVQGLKDLLDTCIAEGDAFLFRRVVNILGASPSASDWLRLGDRALELGKLRFARMAYLAANATDKISAVDAMLQNGSQPAAGAR